MNPCDTPSRVLKTRWYCGMYVGPSYWQYSGDWVMEPDECEGEWEEEVEEELWLEKMCSSYCPSCGALVQQNDGHADLVED